MLNVFFVLCSTLNSKTHLGDSRRMRASKAMFRSMEDSRLITDSALSSYDRCFHQINSFGWESDCANCTSSPFLYDFMDTRQKSHLVSGIEKILTLHVFILLFLETVFVSNQLQHGKKIKFAKVGRHSRAITLSLC